MPTKAQAKQAFEAMSKDPNIYFKMNEEGKRAAWEYGRDMGYFDRERLNDTAKAEFDKYAGQYVKYANEPTKETLPDMLKIDKYAGYQGAKVPLKPNQTSTPKANIDAAKKEITPQFMKSLMQTTPQNVQVSKEAPPEPKIDVRTDKTVGTSKGKKTTVVQGKLADKNLVRPDNPFAPAMVNALNTATLGAFERNTDAIDQLREKAPIQSTLGSMAGYLVPFGAAKGVVAKGTQTLGKRILTDAAIGAGVDAATEAVKGKNDLETAAKNVGMGAVYGVGADLGLSALGGIGKALSKTDLKAPNINGDIKPQPLNKTAPKANVASEVYTDMTPPKAQIVSGNQKEKLTFQNAAKRFWASFDKAYTRTVDSNNPIKKADPEAYVKATNAKSTGGIVDYVLKDGLVDVKGNKIDKSLREVVENVPKGKENEFWDYMLHRNNIDRATQGKPVYPDYTPEMSAEAARRFETAYPEYKQVGDDIVNWLDKFTRTWGVDAGVVNKEMYEGLRQTYKSYIPTNREFSTLEDAIPQGVRSKFVDQRTPIKKATGSERNIIDPVENIMNLVNRTIRTAKYNEVGQTLLDTVRKNPEKMKQFAEEIPVKDGMFANTDNIVTVMENGKPTYLQINNIDLLQSLNAVPKQINNIKFVSDAMNLYKGLITQKNPIFAIRNIFRDIPSAYVYGSEKNPIKFGADLAKAAKEVATNGESLQRYKAVGGGGANFFNSGDVAKSAKELIAKDRLNPIKAIEKFNNLTETAPRLAEFNRVFEKTGDINKALYAANDVTVNFSRGGDITKSLDRGVPYLNASVQGLDKFFRQVKNKPLETIAKAGISITAPTVGLYLINKDNPNYQQLDNRTKDGYFLIPNLNDTDEQGNAKTFVKIPKSRELSVLFSALFERTARAAEGQDKAFKGFTNTVATNFSPTNPIENNILSPLAYNIPTNKDFAGRSIVPQGMIMDNRSPYLQYDEKTSEIAKKIGELTKDVNGGLSPKQIDYILRSYTGIIAQYGLPLNTKGSDPLKALTTQFKADPIYSNQTLTDFYDNLDKAKREAADTNIIGKIPSKLVTPKEKTRNILNKASLQISDLNKQIKQLDQVKDKAKIQELRRRILKIANDANNVVKSK
jgi:hypothetical protein